MGFFNFIGPNPEARAERKTRLEIVDRAKLIATVMEHQVKSLGKEPPFRENIGPCPETTEEEAYMMTIGKNAAAILYPLLDYDHSLSLQESITAGDTDAPLKFKGELYVVMNSFNSAAENDPFAVFY